MKVRSESWKAGVAAVHGILRHEWNPIGCAVPEDEYDRYIGGICED
jgi:hypothetical protein